jgi:ABC-type multidrug transport system fused ATPase/permease subunit
MNEFKEWIERDQAAQLLWAISHAMQLRGQALDPLHLEAAAASAKALSAPLAGLYNACSFLGLPRPNLLRVPDLAHAPLLAHVREKGWGIIAECTPEGQWMLTNKDGVHKLSELGRRDYFLRLSAASVLADDPGKSRSIIRKIMTLRGQFDLADVTFNYPGNRPGIHISRMHISPGERVAILGAIGSGKSTLLRVLAGLYHPQTGRVLIDGVDIGRVSRPVLNRQIAYMAQDHRLFQGTLRENLLIGVPDPGDDVVRQALARSGLLRIVSNHPRGLELPIREGGTGLSGGQRQLVAFTRLLLVQPSILLLDEPTASMDKGQEQRCLAVLAEEMNVRQRTLVVVTHKQSMLPLVSRLVVVAGSQIMCDGPRDEVLAHLAQLTSQAVVAFADYSARATIAPTAAQGNQELPTP